MDPLTIAMMGGTALAGLLQGQAAKSTANENLAFQRQNALDQIRFAKAGRTDAYGNNTTFDEPSNRWITQLTPQQRSLLDAGQHEQLLNLTTDVTQNREQRRRMEALNRVGAEDFTKAHAQQEYGAPASEASIRDDLMRLMVRAKPGPTVDLNTIGNGPIISRNPNTGDSNIADLAQIMLKARSGALGERQQRMSEFNAEVQPKLASARSFATAGGASTPINMPTTARDIGDQTDNLTKNLMDAYKSSSATNENAAKLLTEATGKQFPTNDMTRLTLGMMQQNKKKPVDNTGYYGGSPETNPWLNPSTYNY